MSAMLIRTPLNWRNLLATYALICSFVWGMAIGISGGDFRPAAFLSAAERSVSLGLNLAGIRVMSAGLAAMMGGPAAREAVAVLAESGIDLKNHESQPVTEMLVRHADLILTMTRSHRNALLAEWPDAADRTKLVNRSGADVVDPIGGSPEVYRQCAGKLRGELEAWVNEIPLS